MNRMALMNKRCSEVMKDLRMQQPGNSTIAVEGHIDPQFAQVLKAFITNFEQGREIGASIIVASWLLIWPGGCEITFRASLTLAKPYSRSSQPPKGLPRSQRTCWRIEANSISTRLSPRIGRSSHRQTNPRYQFDGC